MKHIIQKEHTSFKLLNLANGDMRVTLDTGLSGINFGVPLILEGEFRKEVAQAVHPDVFKENERLKELLRESIRIYVSDIDEHGCPNESILNILKRLKEINELVSK